jgi:hypothetical protein
LKSGAERASRVAKKKQIRVFSFVRGLPITPVSVCQIERHSRESLPRRSKPGHEQTMQCDPKPSTRQEIMSISSISSNSSALQYQATLAAQAAQAAQTAQTTQATQTTAPSTAPAATIPGHHHHGSDDASSAATPPVAATSNTASNVGSLLGSIIDTVA